MSAWSLIETDFASFVSAAKLSRAIATSDRSSHFRLHLDWLSYREGFQTCRSISMRRSSTTRSAVDVNEPFYLRSKGARCHRGASRRRRGEQRLTELERWTERNRNFIPVTIGQTTRYRPRECQPFEYRSPRRGRLTRLWIFFHLGTDRRAGWSTLSREGERWHHLTSRGQGHGYSLSMVSKVPARSGNATHVSMNFSRVETSPLFSNCLHKYSASIFNRPVISTYDSKHFFFIQFYFTQLNETKDPSSTKLVNTKADITKSVLDIQK